MSDKHGTYVFVVENGVAHRRNVKIRLETADAALIAGKVSAGARVVVSGNAGVEDGTHVRTH